MANFRIDHYDDTPIFRLGSGAEKIGTPIAALEPLYDGALVPGYYDFTFSSVVPGVTATVTITAPSTNFGINGKITALVPLTEAWVYNLVPGTRIKFDSDLGFLSSWKDRAYCGVWMGNHKAGNPDGVTIDASDGPTFTLTTGEPIGSPAYYSRWKIVNTSVKKAFECFAIFETNFAHLNRNNSTGKALSYAFTDDTESVEKFDPANGGSVTPYVFTFENKDVAGAGLITFKVDGALVDEGVLNTSTGASSSSSNVPYGDTILRFTEGDLKGVRIAIDAAITNSDSIELWIFSPRWTEGTPDTGTGAPTERRDDGIEDGTTWGTSPVGLTEIGEGVREISSSGSVVIHTKTTIPPGAPFGLNPAIFVGFVIRAGLSNPVGI